MAMTATRNPAALTWGNFTPVATLTDPADGGVMDAYTSFDYHPPAGTQIIAGQVAFADGQTLRITPNCRVRIGAAQTAGLLAHEQFHYDLGFVIARVVVKEMMRLRAANIPGLAAEQNKVFALHFSTRAGLIQRRYDIDTRHGTNAHYQRHYLSLMTACLGNANATQIGGWYL